MSDSIKDGVGLDPAIGEEKASTAGRDGAAERDLIQSMKLYQAGERQEALRLVRPWADRGDERACLLAARLYKDEGDAVRCRNYLYTAAEQGDGDAALMLAREYLSEDPVAALEWAEKAHERQVTGAGRLIIRLASTKGSWAEVIRLAAEELAWLEDTQAEELFSDLDAVLKGNHLSDRDVLNVLEPIEQSLPKGSKGQTLLSVPCQQLREKFKDQRAKEKKAKRQAKARQVGHQAAKTTTSALGALRIPFFLLLAAAAAFGLNIVAHKMVGENDYFGVVIWGFLNCYLCNRLMVLIRTIAERNMKGNGLSEILFEGLGMFLLKMVVWAIPCAALGYMLCWQDTLREFFGSPEIGTLRIGTILLAFVEGLYGAFSDDFGL